jgi:hypothetical protein
MLVETKMLRGIFGPRRRTYKEVTGNCMLRGFTV